MEKEKIKKYFNDKKIVRNIYVKDKLINLIVSSKEHLKEA